MSRKGSRKIKPLLKDEALQREDSKLDDKQAHDNLGYNPSREDKDNERKMLVIHEGDSSGLDETETETEQRAVPSRTRTERESTMNTHHSNLPEETEDNQYSTLSRTNKQQSGEISNSNRNIDIKKTEQKPPQKQSESPVGSDTKKPENFYSTLKKTSPKEDGLYNPYAVDNTNIDDYSPRKMDNKQTKTAIYDTIGDKKSSENDYSTLKRETKAQTSPIQPAVPALRPGGRAVDNDYSSLRRTSKRTAAPQRQNADLSKNKGKGVPDLKGNEPTYATVEQRKRPDNTYNTLDRTLSQENLLNRASWTSTDSLLYNPYAVDDTETVPSDRRNISNPLYNHLDKTRAEAQSSAFGGVSAAGSVSNGSAIDFKGAQTNFGFADEYESGLYTELTNYQQGALIDDISETSDSSDQFCSPLRILHNNCVSVVLFVVLFLSVLALFFVILAIAGKAGPGCSKECTGKIFYAFDFWLFIYFYPAAWLAQW